MQNKRTKNIHTLEEIIITVSKILPSLPKPVTEIIIKMMPKIAFWGSVLISVLTLYFIFFDPQINNLDTLEKINYYLFLCFCIILSVSLFFSSSALDKKSVRGWRIVYYLCLILLLLFTITINFAGLISLFLIFYLLSQIRHYYV